MVMVWQEAYRNVVDVALDPSPCIYVPVPWFLGGLSLYLLLSPAAYFVQLVATLPACTDGWESGKVEASWGSP